MRAPPPPQVINRGGEIISPFDVEEAVITHPRVKVRGHRRCWGGVGWGGSPCHRRLPYLDGSSKFYLMSCDMLLLIIVAMVLAALCCWFCLLYSHHYLTLMVALMSFALTIGMAMRGRTAWLSVRRTRCCRRPSASSSSPR